MTTRLGHILTNIAKAADRAGRNPTEIKLMAVTKNQPIEKILPLLQAGHRLFGENKVQEACKKWPKLKELYPDIELHLIGQLQSNKVKEAVSIFDVVQTLDSARLGAKLANEQQRQAKQLKYLLEVNIGKEPQKAGISSQELPMLLATCRADYALRIIGVMCIPPKGKDPTSYFERLKNLATRNSLPEISMGMSEDYEVAIMQGATMVRIGTALFA